MLHGLGFETHPKPKGMNLEDFHVRISENGGGMLYIYSSRMKIKNRACQKTLGSV